MKQAVVDGDSDLRDIWRPLWEQKTTRNFATGIRETIAECINYCHLISELMTEDAEGSLRQGGRKAGWFRTRVPWVSDRDSSPC